MDPKNFWNEWVKRWTVDEAAAEVERRVYAALDILEDLEEAGRIIGNGHHARQKIAAAAAEDLRARWFLREFAGPKE